MSRSLTTQDISWFLDLFDKKQLNLDPPYQRRSVWSPKDRRYFIDTILNDYPAPPVFLHKTLDDSGRATYHVVDGKQRLQTIIMFRDNKIAIPSDFSDVTLQKKRWKDLEKATREKFWNYVLIVEMLPDAGDAAIRNTFERINRNSRKLTAQEMRHAKYDGWFITAVEAEASQAEWKTYGIATTSRAKRMADNQFISELFAVIIRKELSGFDQDHLDELYAEYDEIEEDGLFVEDSFNAELRRCKDFVSEMIKTEPSVVDHLKQQGHFYSLWGLIALEPSLADPAELAKRYVEFMTRVDQQLANPGTSEPLVSDYAANIRGASTDKAQRLARHAALLGMVTASETA